MRYNFYVITADSIFEMTPKIKYLIYDFDNEEFIPGCYVRTPGDEIRMYADNFCEVLKSRVELKNRIGAKFKHKKTMQRYPELFI